MSPSVHSSPARRVTTWVLVLLGTVAAVAAILGAYANYALFDAGRFADRAAAVLSEEPVRDRIATEVTDQLILEADRDLVAVRPLIQGAVAEVVSSGAVGGLFRAGVMDFHRAAVGGDADTATVLLGDIGTVAAAAIETQYPDLADRLPSTIFTEVDLDGTVWASDGWIALAETLAGMWFLLALLALACFGVATVLGTDRRKVLVSSSLGLAAAGGICFAATRFLKEEAVSAFVSADDRNVAGAVFGVFFDDLVVWSLIVVGVGLVLAAACGSLVKPLGLDRRVAQAAQLIVRQPERPAARVLRAIVFILFGAFLLLETSIAIELLLMIAGATLVYIGIEELLRLIPEPEPEPEDEQDSKGRRKVNRTIKVAAAAGLLIVLLGGGTAVTGTLDLPDHDSGYSCNGSEDFCDRPLDQLVLPSTHNSMAAQTIPGWNFPQQERDVRAQLDDGIRGLTIDAYYGREVGGRVRTEIDQNGFRENLEETLGGSAAAAAERIRDRLVGGNVKPGPVEVWLCHGVCEVGAIRMRTVLEQVRDFMAGNPNEVVSMIIQDEGVTPKDINREFEKSGLLEYVYKEPLDGKMPTPREMIDSGGRLMVFAENVPGGDEVPWYHDAFTYIQETPFHFTDRSQFSCRENRGESDSPLFLMNHWVDTSPAPRPSNAAVVNDRKVLLERALQCEKERGLLPNMVAVDFYRTGDLFEVVDELNRRTSNP